jgi:EAL domain-containing protein (putative c-di-GMP-specific phosphodiesterase class I)
LQDIEYHSSCSIGISLFRAHDVSVDDLLRRADTAMYEAKTGGRNALRFFDPSMQAALENRSMLEADLRHALSQQQFVLFYQIHVNAASQPIGAEALLRWMHPIKGLVLPDDFIHLAEETGLILPIGLWVLETACAQIKAWAANSLACELQLAVNVSARQFHQPDFVEQVREALKKTGADPTRLKLELTESVVLGNIDDTVAKMHELKGIGVRFSMDDFGTGYSSLSYLTQLPLDQLKIDRSFVGNIGTKLTDAVIVQTIIGMGHSLGMEVIAEGVETDAQRAFLEHAGCIAYQGFLFSKPVSLEEFENVLLIGGFAQAGIGSQP